LKNANHIIEKVLVEVNTSNVETAHFIKNNIDVFLKDELFPQIEILFDDYQFQEGIIRFDEINLNLSLNKWEDFNGLKNEIYKQLKEKIDFRANQRFQSENVKNNEFNFDKKDVQKVSTDFNTSEVFLFFLENGYLPWYARREQFDNFIDTEKWSKALENESFKQKLERLLVTNEVADERFVIQFSDDIFLKYLIQNNSGIKKEVHGILKIIKNLDHSSRLLFLKLMLHISRNEYDSLFKILTFLESSILKTGETVLDSKKNQVVQEIKGIVQKLIPEIVLNQAGFTKNKNRIVEKPFEKEDLKKEATGYEKDDTVLIARVKDDAENIASDEIDEDQIVSDEIKARQLKKEKTVADIVKTDRTETDGFDKKTESKYSKAVAKENVTFLDKDKNEIWVQNAGLILLHPFLKPFFITTEICDKQGRFLSEDYDLPIQSIHYLATGDENFFEGNLIFEKFLCGVPLKIPVRQTSVLTDLIKTEATVLLNEVVKNWPALKNTSADGLRQMFIQRDGKLIQKEDSYKLIVERKAQDVLLEKLNWNISMVKLPWISKILFTEW
jgi:hypothetical protein